MQHPKAKTEYPEDVRGRVEDIKQKSNTARNEVTCGGERLSSTIPNTLNTQKPLLATTFRDFEWNLSILKKWNERQMQ